MKKALFATIVGMSLFMAQPGHAVIIAGIGDDFTIDWLLAANQPDNDGGVTVPIALSATAAFDVVEFSAASFKMNISFSNTTVVDAVVTQAGITTFGIGVDPNATNVVFTDDSDSGFTDAEVQSPQQNFPGGFKNIDICVFTQGCSGGSQGSALAAGASDSFTLTIFGDFSGGSVTLDPFPIKFQTNLGSLEFGRIPEPMSLSLFGIGLLGLGLLSYRRRTAGRSIPPRA